MSNESTFALRFTSRDYNQLTKVRHYLSTTPWPWNLEEIERCLPPGTGYRFRATVRGLENTTSQWISGDYGLLAEVLDRFPGLRIDGIFRDGYGHGFLDGTDKEYEYQYPTEPADIEENLANDEEEPSDPEEEPLAFPRLIQIVSETPLAESDREFNQKLEALADILRDLGAADLGCTLVDDGTLEWSLSAELDSLTPEQILWIGHQLRQLRLPLDTRILRGGAPPTGIWPVSNRPWQMYF